MQLCKPKLLSLAATLLILGTGCTSSQQSAAPSTPPVEKAAAPLSSDGHLPSYFDLFQRDAKPEWQEISTHGFRVSIPYSTQWTIGSVGLSVYDVVDESVDAISFGRPINGGMYISREYDLYRKPKESLGDLAVQSLSDQCPDHQPAEKITVGKIAGIQFTEGGAKGCNLSFTFTVGSHTYVLSHIPDFSNLPAKTIEPDMQKIIESVRE